MTPNSRPSGRRTRGLPPLWGDPQRLAQVLGNLLDNALRHTPPAGRVMLSVNVDRDWLVLQVADNGDGIAAEHLPHLFERFYRVDAARNREHGGAGIGLAITKALVEAHGGHISAASAGRGPFTIVLPLRAQQVARAAPSPNRHSRHVPKLRVTSACLTSEPVASERRSVTATGASPASWRFPRC